MNSVKVDACVESNVIVEYRTAPRAATCRYSLGHSASDRQRGSAMPELSMAVLVPSAKRAATNKSND